jgi:hypothetical protein
MESGLYIRERGKGRVNGGEVWMERKIRDPGASGITEETESTREERRG